ncbi:MAG: toll/interleukin-1 receptor domain-containing protein [Planctomycetaceae bacterium]
MPHDVFVSYSSPNREVAEAACAALEGRGMKCWIAPRDVTAGESWSGEIVEAIAQAKLMVLVFSSEANASKHVLREVERAVHHGIPVIPLRIEKVRPTKELEYFLSVKHWLEAESRPIDPHLDRLAETIQGLLSRGPRPEEPNPAAAPSETAPASRPVQPPHSARPVSSSSATSPDSPPSTKLEEPPVWKRREVLAGLALLPVLGGAGWWWLSRTSDQPVPPPIPEPDGIPGIDLLAKIDERRDALQGSILRRGNSLVLRGKGAQDSGVTLAVPWQPPPAYRLHLRIGRVRDGEGTITLGLAAGEAKFVVLMDAGKEGELRTGLPGDKRGEWVESAPTRRFLVPKPNAASKGSPPTLVDLVVTVQADRVELLLKESSLPGPKRRGKDWTVFSYRGDVSQLRRPGRQRPTPLFLSCPKGLVLEQLILEPLGDDPGKPVESAATP